MLTAQLVELLEDSDSLQVTARSTLQKALMRGRDTFTSRWSGRRVDQSARVLQHGFQLRIILRQAAPMLVILTLRLLLGLYPVHVLREEFPLLHYALAWELEPVLRVL